MQSFVEPSGTIIRLRSHVKINWILSIYVTPGLRQLPQPQNKEYPITILYNKNVKILEELKIKNPDLKQAEIEGILGLLLNKGTQTPATLTNYTGIPKETLKTFIKSISSFLEQPQNDKFTLTKAAQATFKELNLRSYKFKSVEYNDLLLRNPKASEALETFEKIRKKYTLTSKREYDQFFATPQTSISKALVLIEKGLVQGKNILLLGDDDWVSVALALLEPTYNKIQILDIDPELLALIEKISTDYNFKNIKTEVYDVRKPIPSRHVAIYDVVMTDPPYTKSGIDLFLNRSAVFLGPTKNFADKYVFLFYGNSFKSPEKFIKIQEVIGSYGLVIEDRFNKFASYTGADSIGSASSLYILKTTSATKPRDDYLDNNIYTFENVAEEKFPYVDHIVFKVHKVPETIINSKSALLKKLGEICNIHKLKVLDTKITSFPKQGLTITYILSNSNFVIHTWPEFGALHMDLITCAPIYNKDRIARTVSDLFGTRSVEVRVID